MLQIATAADAEAIFSLLFSARKEIPLKIEVEWIEDWLDRCALDRSCVAERDGEVISVKLVGARAQSSAANFCRENGEPPKEWELLYGVTHKDYRKEGLCRTLFRKSVNPLAETLCRWGFTEVSRYDNRTIEWHERPVINTAT